MNPIDYTSFYNSLQKSIGDLYTEFYEESELNLLTQELYSIYSICSDTEDICVDILSNKQDDPLLRHNLNCIVILCNSVPFFTSRVRRHLHLNRIEVNRSIHFHPIQGKEMFYIEVKKVSIDSLRHLTNQIIEYYHKVIKLTRDYRNFIDRYKESFSNLWESHQELLQWILEKGYIWEGAYYRPSQEDKEYKFGNLEIEQSVWDWFYSLPIKNEVDFYSLETSTPSFLGDYDIFYFAFTNQSEKILLKGSLSQIAIHSGLSDIPILKNNWEQFLNDRNIEYFSGLGRTARMMFNYTPTELLFLMKDKHYSTVYTALMDRSLKTSTGVTSILLDSNSVLFLYFVEESNWSEEQVNQCESIVKKYIVGSTIKNYQVFKGNIIQGYILVRSNGLSKEKIRSISAEMLEVFRTWKEKVLKLWFEKYKSVIEIEFPLEYIASHSAEVAVQDLEIAHSIGAKRVELKFLESSSSKVVLNAVTPQLEYALSLWVNVLINFGLSPTSQKVYDFQFNGSKFSKSEFYLIGLSNSNELYFRLEKAIAYTMEGILPLDKLSGLVLNTNLDTNGVFFLKAMRDYCLQTKSEFHRTEFSEILLNHPEFSEFSWKYFLNKFKNGIVEGEEQLTKLTDRAKTLKEDEVLNSIRTAILAIVRTNFFGLGSKDSKQPSEVGIDREVVAFKIDSSIPIALPHPRPFREIFVYSSNFQGIHLRGGAVARGGLRFSDRPSDYRTEVLSLMKTQMVKNALIVPVGCKGGFVLTKNSFSKKEFNMVDGYKRYVSSLLDLTDNRLAGKIIPFAESTGPFSYDGEDSYFVVAADKGTAQLSDTANSISLNRNFWLGDAFASGGSKGYSHKELGITAKGALVTADRHFRNLNIDFRNEPITMVGVGDMGGDVFGNGLLESRFFRLLAAFNHKHIFLDPNPDPSKSYEERKRLFYSKNSGWDFYDKQLISTGGGVFDRNNKSIPISKEVRASLGIESEYLSGIELIKAILKAPVDLLYNGGIGTYIKSEKEENAHVGDPSNNEVRVNGSELRAKVVCEGGNLGFTQKGRIEFAQKGGLIYTDALDNSAGVDLSDHEVNLKLFCFSIQEKGLLKSEQERDILLKRIVQDVTKKVLWNNALQSLAVNVDHYESEKLGWEGFIKSADYLISKNILVPNAEIIPSTLEEWEKWKDKSLSIPRPALCVLLGYAKMDLYSESLDKKLFLPTNLKDFYYQYFPEELVETYTQYLLEHPLSVEILTTIAINFYVNLLGVTSILLPGKSNRESRIQTIVKSLYSEGYFQLLNELAQIREKGYEQEIVEFIFQLRQMIRAKYTPSKGIEELNRFKVLDLLSPATKEKIFK